MEKLLFLILAVSISNFGVSQNEKIYQDSYSTIIDSLHNTIEDFVIVDIFSDVEIQLKLDTCFSYDKIFVCSQTFEIIFHPDESLLLLSSVDIKKDKTRWKAAMKFVEFEEYIHQNNKLPYEMIKRFDMKFFICFGDIKLLYAEYELKANEKNIEILNRKIEFLK